MTVATLPTASGNGRLLCCQFGLQNHIAPDSGSCDPAAATILPNLLGW
jgi:hypothetical protein